MKSWISCFVLTAAFGCSAFLFADSYVGMGGWSNVPSTKSPLAHFATDRKALPDSARKVTSNDGEQGELVVSLDEFSYTGLIKASATNPYAPPPRRPPAKKK